MTDRQATKDVGEGSNLVVLRIINETTVVALPSSMENKSNGKTEVNLDDKFERSRQCAPTRMTTRPFSQGPYNDSARGRRHEGVVSQVPADAAPGKAPLVPSDQEAPNQRKRSDGCRSQKGRRRAIRNSLEGIGLASRGP